ncbi:helix-turn-helix domain-containing protein [Ferrimicrobium sp.]|uniref:helix-turn-helix domain-containing protein n=1 Tax=Ferrimicrobium sp. TaxID=2926050 RepID=UPI00261E4767|nr:helix-turn-helix domain-containing protein [Ferrimicrobium sp.]
MCGSKREIKRGVLELRVFLEKDPVTGKYKVHSKTFHGSAQAADEPLRDLIDQQAPLRLRWDRSDLRSAPRVRPLFRLTVTVEEAAVVLGISRATAYDAVNRGEIPCIRIGRRILVPVVALNRLLESAGPDESGDT